MPWKLARTTANLNDDASWDGQVVGTASGPAASLFFPVGTPGGAKVHDGNKITVRVGFVDDVGSPVAGAGTCTAEPVSADDLPMPAPTSGGDPPGQTNQVASVGTALVDVAAWNPTAVEVQPRGLWTLRLSAMVNASATRACVWYWADRE